MNIWTGLIVALTAATAYFLAQPSDRLPLNLPLNDFSLAARPRRLPRRLPLHAEEESRAAERLRGHRAQPAMVASAGAPAGIGARARHDETDTSHVEKGQPG